MSQRVVVILLVALIIAGGASLMVYRTVRQAAASGSTLPVSEVVVAARNLEVGALLKESDLKLGSWPGGAPKGVAVKKDSLIGRGVVFPIYEGEPINDSRLAAVGAGAGLAATIPQGMRACAVRVNEVVGVAGFLVPGMRVDVLISGNAPGAPGTSGPRVKTLLQNIEVLSAGQNIQKDAEGKPISVPVVNLLVTPEQAEILSLASNETRIQLVLRNPLDTQIAKTTGNAVANLFGSEPTAPKAAASPRPARPRVAAPPQAPRVEPAVQRTMAGPPPHLIEVLNGGKRSEARFPTQTEAKQ